MKIVLDLQGAQSNSRYRGIGRYSLSMAKAFVAAAGEHEVWLALNGCHAESAVELVAQFEQLLPRERMLVYELPKDIAGCVAGNRSRARIAEAVQADFLEGLPVDCIWHSSMFEGWGDDSIAALGGAGNDHRHAATLYDLIPLLHPDRHLHDPRYRLWYYRRLGLLKRCGLLLAISESSRREAIECLNLDPSRMAVVDAAADEVFQPTVASDLDWARWRTEDGIHPGYILYAGGYDAHKNIDGLLIAYADLPVELRQRHPLILAGRCDVQVKRHLRIHARKYGLSEGSVIFTGDIADVELAKLYSNCTLFVAPSLHEGFGLPALEAMSCGAAVVGSNTASLPEVIGHAEALFDPRSPASMTEKLSQVLRDTPMRHALREHGRLHARRFSWAASAKKAWEALEHRYVAAEVTSKRRVRPSLIYVSPLPPARSGIADYSAKLLRELATHYSIEVVAEQPEVLDPWVLGNFPVRSMEWLLASANDGMRILYHMGNSPLHAGMFQAIKDRPGVVVLHDFYLGAVRNWMAQAVGGEELFQRELYASHGYRALCHDRRHGRASTLDTYPINLDVIENALGIIVHSRHAADLAHDHYGPHAAAKLELAPFAKAVSRGSKHRARRMLGIDANDFVVCSFGMLAPTKLNHRLLASWLRSSLADDARCHLFFVGENHGGEYGAELLETIRSARCRKRLHITGFVNEDRYAAYLQAADIAVQLRTASRGETSAAIFDALAQGLPLIVNAHGSAAELPAEILLRMDDSFEDGDLAQALLRLREDPLLRRKLAQDSIEWVHGHHHPATVAKRYGEIIEHFHRASIEAGGSRLLTALDDPGSSWMDGVRLRQSVAALMARNHPWPDGPRLFVDVTATSRSTLHTGIERVVRGVLAQLLETEGRPWRVEPVKLVEGRYVRAESYALHLIQCPDMRLADEEIFPRRGDILLGLDWVADALPASTAVLDAWRLRGVRMIFVVYDLLPVLRSQWFPVGTASMHAQWLRCIGRYADALIGISKTVVEDLRQWFDRHPPERRGPLRLGYFYPGSDLAATRPTDGMPAAAASWLAQLRRVPTFLMVGTVEPRKGHAFVLDAFERLWAEGSLAMLVVVGREGWLSNDVAARMRAMSRDKSRLVWLEQASDEYLEELYAASHALIAASEAEGFGLPLVEAARRGLPVIARDIPVFREVSSVFAHYFDGNKLDGLVGLVRKVVAGEIVTKPGSSEMGLSWQATTSRLQEMLVDAEHAQWMDPWLPK